MAYTVSATYLAQINNLLRKPRAYIDFGSGVYAYDNSNLVNFKISAELQKNGSLFGNTPSKYIKIEIKNPNNATYSLTEGNTFNAYLGITLNYGLVSESVEYVPQGLFTITHITRDTVKERLIIEGFDNMIKFNAAFDNTISYPTTLGGLISGLCTAAGITFNNPTFTGNTIALTTKPNVVANQNTLRDILGWAAEVAGANAIITRNGQLKIVLLNGASAATFTKNNYFEYNSGETTNAFNAVYDAHSPEEDNISYPIPLPGTVYAYTMYNNPVVYFDRASTIDNTYAAINGVGYQGYQVINRGLYYLDLCDKITITNPAGTTFTSFVLNMDLEYDGSTKETLRADKYSATEVAVQPITTREAMQQAQIIVDKLNGEVSIIAGNYNNGVLNGAKYTFDGNTASFYNGGLTIYNATNNAVFTADVNGDMTLVGDFVNKDTNGYDRIRISDDRITFRDQNNIEGAKIDAYNKNLRIYTPYTNAAAGSAAATIDAQTIALTATQGDNASNSVVLGLDPRGSNGLEIFTRNKINFIGMNGLTYQNAPAGTVYNIWHEGNDSPLARVSNVYDDSSTYRQYLAKGGSATGYMRTPSNGLIPSANGSGGLGTSTWRFASLYANALYQGTQEVLSIAGEETTNPYTLKMSDGTIIKWGTFTVTTAITAAYGGLYQSGALSYTFDTTYPFTVAPAVAVHSTITAGGTMVRGYPVSTTALGYILVAPTSTASATYTIRFFAIGR